MMVKTQREGLLQHHAVQRCIFCTWRVTAVAGQYLHIVGQTWVVGSITQEICGFCRSTVWRAVVRVGTQHNSSSRQQQPAPGRDKRDMTASEKPDHAMQSYLILNHTHAESYLYLQFSFPEISACWAVTESHAMNDAISIFIASRSFGQTRLAEPLHRSSYVNATPLSTLGDVVCF